MRPQPALCDVKAVQQCRKCRTEKPVTQEVGRKVYQNGRIGVPKPDSEKEMHRIIGGKQQQRYPHDPTGAQIIAENDFFRYVGQQKIKAEEQHQRQRNEKRVFIYCIIHYYLVVFISISGLLKDYRLRPHLLGTKDYSLAVEFASCLSLTATTSLGAQKRSLMDDVPSPLVMMTGVPWLL